MTNVNQDGLIFLSIAAYRDPQLTPTVLDCIHKADEPGRLRFGICRQRDAQEERPPFLDDARFRVLDVDWRESKGACWARAEVMKLWQGEDWFFQVDSHCRFVNGWDTRLLQAAAETGSQKPILSTYATPFTPGKYELLGGEPLQIALQGFTADGIPQLKPAGFPRSQIGGRPLRARFLAAGFLFAPGCFVEEVPYDPELYFMGEEASMTIRAFTHGYDLFHPSGTTVWHDYLRADSKKHWGDHIEEGRVAQTWSDLDGKSRDRIQQLLRGGLDGRFGLGNARTLAQYEAYAGISLKHRKAQHYTVRAEEPPNPPADSDWPDSIFPWIVRVVVPRAELPAGSLDDPSFWYLGICDEHGNELYRLDFPPDKLALLHGNEEDVTLVCDFFSEMIPATWMLWPLSRSRGWLTKITGRLSEKDFAILKEEDDQRREVLF